MICRPLARLDAAGCPALTDRAHFAACAGAAPIEASSGAIQRHRLSRNGNRQLNSTLHTVAITQSRSQVLAARSTSANSPQAKPLAKPVEPINAT